MLSRVGRVTLIVLDSVGCGDAPDAAKYGDEAANTLGNIARAVGGLNLPHLAQMGLGRIADIQGVPAVVQARGSFGRLTEVSAGKDTTTGHWELAGYVLERPFPTYPKGFPPFLIHQFEQRIGRRTIGNYPASGTEIIKNLGEEHSRTGFPIIYTSADSVFQIAAHEDIIPVPRLYEMCEVARGLLTGDDAVGRVIARPFTGSANAFRRSESRKDFSLAPPTDTILDVLKNAGMNVLGVGKIEDIFAYRGLTLSNHTGNNMAGVDAIIEYLSLQHHGLIFANLVDFDSLYGHRNDAVGYARALEEFDRRLPDILQRMRPEDVLIITADHGNDPTIPGTDHTRERVPIIVYGNNIQSNNALGTRSSFADVAATVADLLGVPWRASGKSFADLLLTNKPAA